MRLDGVEIYDRIFSPPSTFLHGMVTHKLTASMFEQYVKKEDYFKRKCLSVFPISTFSFTINKS